MRARYTDTALVELDDAVSYLIERNPSSAAALAGLVDAAVARLLDHPYAAEETEMPGVRRVYIRRFRYSVFYPGRRRHRHPSLRHAARRWPWEE